VPIPERLISILGHRIEGRVAGGAGSPDLGVPECAYTISDSPTRRWLDRRGADLKLLRGTMGHASIVVTARTYADLYDSDLDRLADALVGLGG
jgi:hypothetical protein